MIDDLESNININQDIDNNHYKISLHDLQSLFDPKSIKNLISIGGINSLINDLNTNINSGLPIDIDQFDINKRINIYGENKLPIKENKSFIKLCLEALNDQVLIILSISAIVSLILGLYQTFYQPPEIGDDGKPLPQLQWVDGFAILLAVIIVVIVGALTDYKKQLQFSKLNNKKQDRQIIVYRSNKKIMISIYDLLVGDLLYVETGDVLPADVILINGKCSCDESTITGESKTIKKSTIFKALDYYNNEIKSIDSNNNSNSNSNSYLNPPPYPQHSNSPYSSSSSLQFDIGDDGVLDPFLFSGSQLLSGQGKALVICVGENSVNGKIMKSLNDSDNDDEVTPLQNRLNILANNISKYGFLASIILFIVLLSKFLIQIANGEISLTFTQKLSKFINIIITAITIVVVAIPEGLPLAVTLALAFATTRMTEDGNLVRVLKSCETMGGATTICSDKTGTLTINKMTVVKGLIGDEQIFDDISNSYDISNSNHLLNKCSNNLKNYLIKNILLNSTAFENTYDPVTDNNNNNNNITNHPTNSFNIFNWFKSNKGRNILPISSSDSCNESDNEFQSHTAKDEFVGSKTECALLSFVKYNFPQIHDTVENLHNFRELNKKNIVKIIPFESSIKWSGIVYHDFENNEYNFFIKGAGEIILNNCKSLLNINGEIIPMDKKLFEKIDKSRENLANQALRAISLAHYTFQNDEISKINWDSITANDLINYPLILDGIVGIQDPLREGVKNAIDECHRAGVDVRMVTGDNILTARAISKSCGILNDKTFNDPQYYMEGPEFRKLSYNEKIKVVKKLHVLARSSPEDKRILVSILKKLGEVVAVTGDGTNDAPALKLADVGFSMGKSGTEVAREASDIVLMSDEFKLIVNAIKWGRTVAASIRKFVQFQLTVNFTAVFLTFLTAITNKDDSSVLTAVQLLWVNLIMDTLAALALATDKLDDDILDSKPEGRNTKMISFNMWKMIIGMSIFQLIITLTLNFKGCYIIYGKNLNDLTTLELMMVKSMTFNTFVWMQIFTLFVSRILNEPKSLTFNSNLFDRLSTSNVGFFHHITRNYWFIGIICLISILQILIMNFGGRAFSIVQQTPLMWFISLICGYSMIPLGILLRILPDYLLQKYLPFNLLYNLVSWIEWILFGCGIFSSPSVQSREEMREFLNRNDNGIIDDDELSFEISKTPSPMLEASNYVENHKMDKLTIQSNNNNNEHNQRIPTILSSSPSQESLIDEQNNSNNINYTNI